MIFVDQEDAELALEEWQKILRLQDWDIKIQIVRRNDLTEGDGMAEVHYKYTKRMAIVNLLDPIDYGNELWEQDHEVSLVHELLHLHFIGFEAENDTPQDNAQELAIDAISKALVYLRRANEVVLTVEEGD